MSLKENLFRLRKKAGLSQQALAKKSGVAQSMISGLERGTYDTTAQLPELAQALECSVADLDPRYEALPRFNGHANELTLDREFLRRAVQEVVEIAAMMGREDAPRLEERLGIVVAIAIQALGEPPDGPGGGIQSSGASDRLRSRILGAFGLPPRPSSKASS